MDSNISIIACIGKNGELGYKGGLCFKSKVDMAFFRAMTINRIVVMGRKTYESIGHPLEGRRNIVITHRPIEGVECSESIPFVLGYLKGKGEQVFVIGGASIYEQALPFADTIYLTEIEKECQADVFFPKFDKEQFRQIVLKCEDENGVGMKMVEYIRK